MLVLMLVVGLGPAVLGAPRTDKDTLVVAQGFDPRCLSPLFGTAQQDKNVSGQVVERLIQFSPYSLGYLPELAFRWQKTAPDTLRLTLRQGVRFTNGEPFNALSAKYSLDQMLAARSSSGSEVTIWLDRSGAIVRPPSQPDESDAIGGVAGLMAALVLWTVLNGLTRLVLRGFDRHRFRDLDREWEEGAPRWRHHES